TKDLSQHLKALRAASHAPGVSDDVRVRARSLHEQAINQTTRIQRIGRETQRVSALARSAAAQGHGAGGPILDYDGDSQTGRQQQAMIQLQEDEQMAREMEALEADIVLVNELFTTLAAYVHDQGEIVDSIEANTEAAYVQIQSGVQQLQSAVQHRKSARRRKCICGLVFLVIIIIIALAIGISLRSKN
uniref:t-SNARE coiled-coil homology domain-containing protein n=1 Tax=Mesocestoides corti TaxID=53468 RepID=A0A5K3EPD2_MESCO